MYNAPLNNFILHWIIRIQRFLGPNKNEFSRYCIGPYITLLLLNCLPTYYSVMAISKQNLVRSIKICELTPKQKVVLYV